MKHILFSSLGVIFFLSETPTWATEADNTAVNKRDRAEHALTADQQKMNRSDTEITRLIRRAVMKDDSLSTYAHNVKIITVNGRVTLKGPVGSIEEKNRIFTEAIRVAGKNTVTNQLEVKKSE